MNILILFNKMFIFKNVFNVKNTSLHVTNFKRHPRKLKLTNGPEKTKTASNK